MVRKSRLGFIVTLIVTLVTVGPILAGEPTEQIKQTTDKLIAILSDEALKAPEKAAEKKKMIREAVDERFDWEALSRRALGRHWKKMTEEERKAFIPLFGKLLEQTYMEKAGDYSGEQVTYEDERVEGKYALVQVRILTNKYGNIPVTYRVWKKGRGWFIYDVSIEGVSLVGNYRSQFNNILMKASPRELIDRLKKKLEQE